MEKPWAILANFPNHFQTKTLGLHTSRADAEQEAGRYRRCLPGTVTIRVNWMGPKRP